VSVLVNAAGVFGPIALLKDGTDADARYWVETLMINTVAPYLTCRAFVGGMVEHGGACSECDVGGGAAHSGTGE